MTRFGMVWWLVFRNTFSDSAVVPCRLAIAAKGGAWSDTLAACGSMAWHALHQASARRCPAAAPSAAAAAWCMPMRSTAPRAIGALALKQSRILRDMSDLLAVDDQVEHQRIDPCCAGSNGGGASGAF